MRVGGYDFGNHWGGGVPEKWLTFYCWRDSLRRRPCLARPPMRFPGLSADRHFDCLGHRCGVSLDGHCFWHGRRLMFALV